MGLRLEELLAHDARYDFRLLWTRGSHRMKFTHVFLQDGRYAF